MRLLLLLSLLGFLGSPLGVLAGAERVKRGGQNELLPYDPVASTAAVVPASLSGPNARFTVLTSRVVRMEWKHSSDFEDRATPAVLNRKLAVPHFTTKVTSGVLTIETADMRVSYTVGQPFSGSSLSARSISGMEWSWKYGELNSGNLLGTIKSLDELNVISLNCTKIANVKVHDESVRSSLSFFFFLQTGFADVFVSLCFAFPSRY
jgi:hypothetical protein